MSNTADTINKRAIEYNDSVNCQFIDVCRPLFDNFMITQFFYIKIFNDNNTRLYVCSEKKWMESYIQNNFQDDLPHMQTYLPENLNYSLWAGFKKDTVYNAVYDLNIWNGFNIYEKEGTSTVTYAFATTPLNEEMINFYINNLNVLREFIFYFKRKAANIIDTSDPSKLIVSKNKNPTFNIDSRFVKNFSLKSNLQTFSFKGKLLNITFSNRETACLYQLTTGKTSKEIGKLLGISPRTVESYINNVKEKTGYRNKSELIKMFNDNFLEYAG
ncbi:MAG: helix-turn-helix transcriptional regulator [Alphaproteobacteria bacterium]|nr:helix-turn-helix transcriptional regulator [Alphaproteobacteria bacterium]